MSPNLEEVIRIVIALKKIFPLSAAHHYDVIAPAASILDPLGMEIYVRLLSTLSRSKFNKLRASL